MRSIRVWLLATLLVVVVTAFGIPCYSAQATGPLDGRVIVIDPGHGGEDPGAVVNGFKEKDVNLQIALKVKSLLEAAGATTIYTRDGDLTLGNSADHRRSDLEARLQIASESNGDIFISIHADSLEDTSRTGVVVFYGPASGYLYSHTRPLELIARSRNLALTLRDSLRIVASADDRGVRSVPYYLLGKIGIPAVIAEVGTLTNYSEAIRLNDPNYQQQVAASIFSGILTYFINPDGRFIEDLTIPDGTAVMAGSNFTKTWRIMNTGGSAWNEDYRLVFKGRNRLGGPESVPLPHLMPGESGAVSVELQAPTYCGECMGVWTMQGPGGKIFGDDLWVSIGLRDSLPTDPVPQSDSPDAMYYIQTGHNIFGGFRKYFEAYGSIDIFGYPRTEELIEDGMTVQYFQRARFEYHPEFAGTPYEVQLMLLGNYIRNGEPPAETVGPLPTTETQEYFPQTGHSVHFAFLKFFRENGGIYIFGYPVTQEVVEDGRIVQYFQRARFEYHPQHAGTRYEVQLGLLGDFILRQRALLFN